MSNKPKILCLSLYYSTDRILLYTDFLANLAETADPTVWSFSVTEKSFPQDNPNAKYFKLLKSKDSIPSWIVMLRHFNDYMWDQKNEVKSRESIWRLIKKPDVNKTEKMLYKLAKFPSYLGLEKTVSRVVEKSLVRYAACRSSLEEFENDQYDAIVSMVPFSTIHQSAIAAARKKNIPVFAFITSWDNLSTKTRLTFDFDGYIVWSEAMKKELTEFYPWSRNKPIHVVGAVQYDIFRNEKYFISRESFLESYNLDPNKKTVLYCLGSPNFIKEDFGIIDFLEKLDERLLEEIQVIVRLHPGFYEKDYKVIPLIRERYKNLVIQGNKQYFEKVGFQPEESIREWVNTFRHVDIVINLASTVTVDAAIFDKPIINLRYDPQPEQPNQQLVKEINGSWNHFEPVANSGGVWNVNSTVELIEALNGYLADSSIHHEGRGKIVDFVCGNVNGKAGQRMAEAIGKLIQVQPRKITADFQHFDDLEAFEKS